MCLDDSPGAPFLAKACHFVSVFVGYSGLQHVLAAEQADLFGVALNRNENGARVVLTECDIARREFVTHQGCESGDIDFGNG